MTTQPRPCRYNGTSVLGYPRRSAEARGCPGLEQVRGRRTGRFWEKLTMEERRSSTQSAVNLAPSCPALGFGTPCGPCHGTHSPSTHGQRCWAGSGKSPWSAEARPMSTAVAAAERPWPPGTFHQQASQSSKRSSGCLCLYIRPRDRQSFLASDFDDSQATAGLSRQSASRPTSRGHWDSWL